MRIRRLAALSVALLGLFAAASVRAQSFTDVPSSDPIYSAVEELKTRKILSGFTDGTFRSDLPVSRAEAIKILVAAKGVDASSLRSYNTNTFDDVETDAWFRPYVEYARSNLKIIDGPPSVKAFHPDRGITKAEFLKLLLLSQGFDPKSYSEIELPLAPDVTDVKAWYYPYVRLAFATSATVISKSGKFSPDRALTRGDIALLTYRLLMYKEGRRTQDLLSSIEEEVMRVVAALNAKDVQGAQYASARALLAARGAKTITPDEPVVNAAVKVAESYRAITRGYLARTQRKFDDAIKLYRDGWYLAQKAEEMSPSVRKLVASIKKTSQQLADEARRAK